MPSKGVYEFFNAAKIIKEKYPDVIFRLVGGMGTIPMEQLECYRGLVDFVGQQKDVRPFIEDSTVCVLPSYREGFGLVNAEASSVGRAVITCDTNGTRDTVVDGYNGFLIPIKDHIALAEKMEYFILNPEQAEIMGKNGREFAKENFDQVKINQKIYEILEKECE